jgi:protein-S-isoprenylcysteine O-methyltransferase Ste14/NAD-dependent dihydropyrimidine dehydrogenase PreA subunit
MCGTQSQLWKGGWFWQRDNKELLNSGCDGLDGYCGRCQNKTSHKFPTNCCSRKEAIRLTIDPDFRKKKKKAGKEEGIAIWGPVNPPEQLGIRGTAVGVDWDICSGCGICLDVCPMHVYEWRETPGHSSSEKKAFPAREIDCVQCLKCETQCPDQAINATFLGPQSFWDQTMAYLLLLQIIGGVIYGAVFGPYWGLEVLWYLGWVILVLSLLFFLAPVLYFRKRGKSQEGKTLMLTTVIVDSGTYGIVRHPQILGSILLMLASILISQHWAAMVIGILVSVWSYRELLKEEKGLIVKFGNDYISYMQRVPRMNFLLGTVRLLQRRKRG